MRFLEITLDFFSGPSPSKFRAAVLVKSCRRIACAYQKKHRAARFCLVSNDFVGFTKNITLSKGFSAKCHTADAAGPHPAVVLVQSDGRIAAHIRKNALIYKRVFARGHMFI